MTQNTPRDDETLFTPIAKTVIETIDATSSVKNFACKTINSTIKAGSKFAVDQYESPQNKRIVERVSDTYNGTPILSIAFTTVLPLVLFSKSKKFRAVPLSLLGLGLSLKHFYPETISDYAKISVDHYNRLRDRLSNNDEN